jgi:Cu/Ag efflux protein CusF
MRYLTVLASVLAVLSLVVAPAMAQTQPPPAAPARPAPATPATPAAPSAERPKEVEGTVKKVDAATRSVQVSSGLLGLFGATLEVTDDTKISVQGRDGSIADLREGAKVKAAYESRDGKNVARSIDVMPSEDTPRTQ